MPGLNRKSLADEKPAKAKKRASTTPEVIQPPRLLRDIVTYRDVGPGTMDPIDNAERQLEFLSVDFPAWLNDDKVELLESWSLLKADPTNAITFLRFHKAVHTICGNASLLRCEAAGRLAAPLARLLERTPNISKHADTIESAISAIAAAISDQTAETDPMMEEIITGLDTIVERWIAKQSLS